MNDPEMQVRQALAETPADAPVFVDFDETLVFDNSTEAFLSTARPLIIAAALSKMVINLRLYRLFPGPDKQFVWQDWLRVVLTTILLPWTLPLWRFLHAPRLARRAANRPLLDLLATRPADRVVVVSHGFRSIIQPVLRHVAPEARLIASPLFGVPFTRRNGKRAVVERAVGTDEVGRSTFVTDGDNDEDLLGAAARPVAVVWPATDVQSAFRELYLPFLYTERAQNTRRGYMVYGVLLYDVPIITLSYVWILPHPLIGALGVALMHLGLWCVYELGYVENDRFAYEKREVHGKVPSGYVTYSPRVHPSSAWAFAMLISGSGLALVLSANVPEAVILWPGWAAFGRALALWAMFLAAGRVLFAIYNRTKAEFRFLQYPWLHGFRFFGYALFLPLNVVGALLIVAMIFGRWVPYLIYRLADVRWHGSLTVVILVTFLLTVPLAFAVDPAAALSGQSLAAVLWLAFKARKELRPLASGQVAHTVVRTHPAEPGSPANATSRTS